MVVIFYHSAAQFGDVILQPLSGQIRESPILSQTLGTNPRELAHRAPGCQGFETKWGIRGFGPRGVAK